MKRSISECNKSEVKKSSQRYILDQPYRIRRKNVTNERNKYQQDSGRGNDECKRPDDRACSSKDSERKRSDSDTKDDDEGEPHSKKQKVSVVVAYVRPRIQVGETREVVSTAPQNCTIRVSRPSNFDVSNPAQVKVAFVRPFQQSGTTDTYTIEFIDEEEEEESPPP